MDTNLAQQRQEAHVLLDLLPAEKLNAVRSLLDVLVVEDGDLSAADRNAVAASREHFRQGGAALSLEQVAAECGLSMDQVRGSQGG